MGEIDLSTTIVNCCTGERMTLEESSFYRNLNPELLINRITELEEELRAASEMIANLEARIAELEGESV
jgi:hypothetical protein